MRTKLAVVSVNENQYSETFIHNQIKGLTQSLIVYASGYLPTKISSDRGRSFQSLPKGLRSSSEHRLKRSLKQQKITHVLAQYGPSGVQLMHICEELSLPLIVHFHGYDAYRNDVLSEYETKYLELFKKAKAIVVVSKDMMHQLEALGCPKEKIRLLPYGIDTSVFAASDYTSSKKFISCGRFVAKKAPQKTIIAFSKVLKSNPDARLTMIGDGTLFNTSVDLAQNLNIKDKIRFLGKCTTSEVVRELSQADIFVQHSIKTVENDSEGTPLSVLEASAMQLPVVATKHAGIVDAVVDKKTGLLVDEGDVETMAAQMSYLLNHPVEAKKMGISGRSHIEKKYNLKRYLEDLSTLIESC